MLSTGLPQLRSIEDIGYSFVSYPIWDLDRTVSWYLKFSFSHEHSFPCDSYLRESFMLSQRKEDAVEAQWKALLMESLNSKTTAINFFIHNLAHPD